MKKFTKFLVSGLLIVGGLYGISQHVTNDAEVKVAEAATVGDAWYVAGTFNDWGATKMTYNAAKNRYEYILMGATTSTEFKIKFSTTGWTDGKNFGWNDYSKDQGKDEWLQNNGGNFKFKKAGDVLIYIVDPTVDNPNYGPWAGNLGIEAYVPVKNYTITYHADGVEPVTVADGTTWNSKFVEKEGYRLEGWYEDEGLTKEFKKGSAVKSDLNLYPKYVPAEDFKVWFNDNGTFGTKVNAYMFRDKTEGESAKWPGTAITKNDDGLYELTIDASKSFDKIIFNDESKQTVNLDLQYVDGTYTLGAKLGGTSDDKDKYTATWEKYVEPAYNFQVGVKAAEEDPRTLQFFASIDATIAESINTYGEETEYAGNYKVGFKFDFAYGEQVDTRYYTCTATLEALDGVLAEEEGLVAYFAVVVTEIPAEYESVTVTPAYQNLEGVTVYGQAYTYSFVA